MSICLSQNVGPTSAYLSSDCFSSFVYSTTFLKNFHKLILEHIFFLFRNKYWPAFIHEPMTAPLAASSISASSQTIIASLPPSSNEKGINDSPHCLAINFPVFILPVNETLSGFKFIRSAPTLTHRSKLVQDYQGHQLS